MILISESILKEAVKTFFCNAKLTGREPNGEAFNRGVIGMLKALEKIGDISYCHNFNIENIMYKEERCHDQ